MGKMIKTRKTVNRMIIMMNHRTMMDKSKIKYKMKEVNKQRLMSNEDKIYFQKILIQDKSIVDVYMKLLIVIYLKNIKFI